MKIETKFDIGDTVYVLSPAIYTKKDYLNFLIEHTDRLPTERLHIVKSTIVNSHSQKIITDSKSTKIITIYQLKEYGGIRQEKEEHIFESFQDASNFIEKYEPIKRTFYMIEDIPQKKQRHEDNMIKLIVTLVDFIGKCFLPIYEKIENKPEILELLNRESEKLLKRL